MLRQQIVAIRAGAAAIVAQADVILAALSPAASEVPTPLVEQDDAPCRHDPSKRLAVPRMGQPAAWMCAGCGVEGDSKDSEIVTAKEA